MQVVKRNGDKEDLNISQIRKQTIPACEGLKNVSYEELELNSKILMYDGIHTRDIQKSLIKSAQDLISVERSDYSYVAARLILYDLYHNVKRIYNRSGSGDVYKKVTLQDYIDFNKESLSDFYKSYSTTEINYLNDQIVSDRDNLYNLGGIKTLINRYLLKKGSDISELPQHMHMAIAMFVMQNEDKDSRIEYVVELYNATSKLQYVHATPINSNGRTIQGGLISCLVNTIDDTSDSILDKYKEIGMGSRNSAGWGVDVSRIRALGSDIGISKNASSGKIPFVKVINDILLALNQGGRMFAA